MSSMFSSPKSVKASPVPAPAAVPVQDYNSPDTEIKKVRRQFGYEKQVIAGPLVPKSTGKKTLLG